MFVDLFTVDAYPKWPAHPVGWLGITVFTFGSVNIWKYSQDREVSERFVTRKRTPGLNKSLLVQFILTIHRHVPNSEWAVVDDGDRTRRRGGGERERDGGGEAVHDRSGELGSTVESSDRKGESRRANRVR